MQQWGVSYWETYSPVVNMLTVRLLLALCNIHGLESKSIDFILAFPQADLDVDIWMELPTGIVVHGKDNESRAYVLKLKKSLYGLKQASLNWFEKLKQGLMDQGFTPLEIDPCLYLKENMVLLTYVDDCIIISPSRDSIDRLISSMQSGPENFKLTDEGGVNKFLGVEITRLGDNSFELSQPFLINRILNFLGLCNNEFETDANSTSTPVPKGLLHRDLDGKARKYTWKYRTAVGMLSYLQNTSRAEISMAVHQTARFSNNPMLSHEKSIMRIGRYLLDTCKRGIIYRPDKSKGLKCYVDADFSGGWSQADADNADNVLSRTLHNNVCKLSNPLGKPSADRDRAQCR
jgi:histone deacetylase 1/2